MPYPKLQSYIKDELKKGTSKEEITNTLLEVGWAKDDIEQAVRTAGENFYPPTQTPDPQTGRAPQGLLGVFALLGRTWAVYKQHLLVLVAIMAVPVALSLVLQLVISRTDVFSSPALDVAIAFVAIIVIALVYNWAVLALLYAIKGREEHVGFVFSYKRSFNKIIPFIWIWLLSTVVIFGGTIFFIIPGIIFSIWLSFIVYVLVAEDARGMSALLKSREYVRGHWWAVLWRLLFIGAVSTLVYILITLPLLFLEATTITLILSFVLTLLVAPFTIVYNYLLYENLRAIKGPVTLPLQDNTKKIFVGFGIFAVILGIIPLISFFNSFLFLVISFFR